VPFDIPVLEKASEFLGLEKTDVFFIDPQKTTVDENCYIDLLKTF